MSRFFFSCLFMGAVCGVVGGLMASADTLAVPAASTKAAMHSLTVEDFTGPSYYAACSSGLVIVIADCFSVGNLLVTVDFGIGLPRQADIRLTDRRGVHAEHRDELF